MTEYNYNKFLSDSGDEYPTYENNISKYKDEQATFIENIITIENILRDGDQIMIWKGGYQTTFKGMGSTNHTICRKNCKKSTH